MNQTIDLLKAHRSVRKFEKKDVEEDKVKAIVEAAQWSATSSNYQAYTIIRVTDPEKRAKIARLAGGQKWIEECPLFLIFCANLKRSKDCWEEIDPSVLSNAEMFITATVDTALAAQKAFVAAQSLGLGGVYIGGIRNDLQTVCELLDIPDLVYPVFGMCLGYPSESPDQKPRLPMEVIFKKDRYHEDGDDKLLENYNRAMKDYYMERTGGEKEDTWGSHCGSSMMAKTREYLGNFLKARGIGVK